MNSQSPPLRSAEDQARARQAAVVARRDRADVKAALANGQVSFFSALWDPKPSIQRMKVLELLKAVPGVGAIRADAIMGRAGISLSRRIGGLGKHQLAALRKELSLSKIDSPKGALVVMSGPGGVGKSTITSALRADPRFWISISATTRAPRHNEKDGVDYFFLTEENFDRMVAGGEFLEWATFAGARYGTPKAPIESWRELGKHVLLEIEIEGARQVRQADPSALMVFISPPSWEELASRLHQRGTDTPERQAARLALAEAEMAAADEFDHILVNHQVEQVLEQLVSLATAR
ncbi:MAG: guanylate kinase [Actinomycetes bacterium]